MNKQTVAQSGECWPDQMMKPFIGRAGFLEISSPLNRIDDSKKLSEF